MYIVYMAGRPPRQKAKNNARQQLCRKIPPGKPVEQAEIEEISVRCFRGLCLLVQTFSKLVTVSASVFKF